MYEREEPQGKSAINQGRPFVFEDHPWGIYLQFQDQKQMHAAVTQYPKLGIFQSKDRILDNKTAALYRIDGREKYLIELTAKAADIINKQRDHRVPQSSHVNVENFIHQSSPNPYIPQLEEMLAKIDKSNYKCHGGGQEINGKKYPNSIVAIRNELLIVLAKTDLFAEDYVLTLKFIKAKLGPQREEKKIGIISSLGLPGGTIRGGTNVAIYEEIYNLADEALKKHDAEAKKAEVNEQMEKMSKPF